MPCRRSFCSASAAPTRGSTGYADSRKIDLAAAVPGDDGFVIECLEEGSRQVVLVGGSNARAVIYGQDALFDLLRVESDAAEPTALAAGV